MKETMGDRIRIAMEKKGIKKVAELARRAGVSRASVHIWLKCDEIPTPRLRQDVANALGVSTEWLKTGHGPMEAPNPSPLSTDSSVDTDVERVIGLSLSFASKFTSLFELDISDNGKSIIAIHFVGLLKSEKARDVKDIDLNTMGNFIKKILDMVKSKEIV